MGFFKDIKNKVSSSLKGTVKTVGNANTLIFQTAAETTGSSAEAIGGAANRIVSSAGGVLKNPDLQNVLGAASSLGVPIPGNFFNGQPQGGGGGGGFDVGQTVPQPKDNTMLYVLIGGGLLVAVLLLRKG